MSKSYCAAFACILTVLGFAQAADAANYTCPAPNMINCVPVNKTIGPWKDNAAVKSAITPPDEDVVQATIAACSYIYDRYGKFPGQTGPFGTTACYQAHHIDPGFYADKYEKSPVV